ncbi:MAG TPA: hypothetical protein VIU15_03595, partial [Streptomyces sp.]
MGEFCREGVNEVGEKESRPTEKADGPTRAGTADADDSVAGRPNGGRPDTASPSGAAEPASGPSASQPRAQRPHGAPTPGVDAVRPLGEHPHSLGTPNPAGQHTHASLTSATSEAQPGAEDPVGFHPQASEVPVPPAHTSTPGKHPRRFPSPAVLLDPLARLLHLSTHPP